MKNLFTEFQIKDLKSKNRITMAPMCMYTADEAGYANEWHLIHYATRAIGGAGMIILEATAVEPKGRISANDLGIWDDVHIPMLAKIVQKVKEYGSAVGIQLGHAGRKSTSGNGLIAPSAITYSTDYPTPQEMSKQTIQNVIFLFQEAARRALEAGFDFIEIHAAHGYLINQFLSPLTNKRTDEYGGSLENRARFLYEVVDAVRKVWPISKPIFVRVSAEEYDKKGYHPEDVSKVLMPLKDKIDVVDVSSGGVVSVRPDTYPGYQMNFAHIIQTNTGLPVIGGGLLTTEIANKSIEDQNVDLVYFGRELLRNPYYPLQAAKELGIEIQWPKQYTRGK